MTYHAANILFDMMDTVRKKRAVRLFETLCAGTTMSVRDAFIAAVKDECTAIETESLLGQAKGVVQ